MVQQLYVGLWVCGFMLFNIVPGIIFLSIILYSDAQSIMLSFTRRTDIFSMSYGLLTACISVRIWVMILVFGIQQLHAWCLFHDV